ncbi:hybrid sensor histidine kinase/response regulator [Eleftheria terrae]|uniref:hybrid sensor histidine kinase/response regulator n=1 Tax=Eleftheria terrae TaxID=1597781 RepID=UPI00263B3C62|nr:ATP-binding protein [Eleftheria terrae]WKB53868.1 ATP-binding protein [Eleftheria terrae]
MRTVPLQQRLLLLAVAGIFPLALGSGAALVALVKEQRHQAQQATLDVTRALASAVDAELRRNIAVLEALSASPLLDAGDPAAYDGQARRAIASLPDWRNLILSDVEGRVLVHTGYPGGHGMPRQVVEPDSLLQVVRSGRPSVGRLAVGPRGEWGVPVRVPVRREGRLRYVLTGVLKPASFLAVVQAQKVPPDGVVAVFDDRNARVARSRSLDQTVGRPPSPTLAQLLASPADEGVGVTRATEGDRVYTAYVRSPATGWTVAVGRPTAAVEAEATRALATYGGGFLLSLVLGVALALAAARRISGPIDELRLAALAVGRGELPQLPASDILEVQSVADALGASASQRARSEAERERLLGAERSARAAAEQARGRLELLASSGSELSNSLESRTTLQAVASVMVPAIVDWCCIDLLDAEGGLQRALAYHADAERSRQAVELGLRWRGGSGTPGTLAWAVATGSAHHAQFDSPEDLEAIDDPQFREFARGLGMRAHFVVPLVARGRIIGALGAVQAESGRALSRDDRALIAELARRAALALDNARLYADAEAAREQAETANRAKDEFLAMLGHELRNPLAPITTALHLMARRDEGHHTFERGVIERQVAHLSRLVDDLLDVSRITRGKVQLELAPLELQAVVERAMELVEPAGKDRARPVELALPAQPVRVEGDPVRLVQVVCNLLTNALKFTPADGRITLRLSAAAGQAELAVEDEGSGIPAQLLPHVFELFVQGGQALDRRAGGLGLGLAIVRTLVAMHGGTVSASSEGPGRGSRFVVRLPLLGAGPPAGTNEATTPAAAVPDAPRARILIVDDNLDAANSLALVLGDAGHQVKTAADAGAALQVLRSFDAQVAVLDIGLPGIDGYQLASTLRADPGLAGLRLVALTGYGREPDRARALEARFDEHLVKPVAIPRLLAVIAHLLGGGQEIRG